MSGFLRAADQVNNIWKETEPIDLGKTPVAICNNNATQGVGENSIFYGIWIANNDGTIDFFGRESWTILHTITLPEGSSPNYLLDGGSVLYVCDGNGAIHIITKSDLTYTTFTNASLTSPNSICEIYDGSGCFAIGQSDGVLLKTDLSTNHSSIDTQDSSNGGGEIACCPQGPSSTYLFYINPSGYLHQIESMGSLTILDTEEISTTKALWSVNDYRLYHGDTSGNLIIRDSSDMSQIGSYATGMNIDYLFRGFLSYLYFANSSGTFGCFDVQTNEILFNDGVIEGGCCGIVVPADILQYMT